MQEGLPQNVFKFTSHFRVVTFSWHIKFYAFVLYIYIYIYTHRIITTNTALKPTYNLVVLVCVGVRVEAVWFSGSDFKSGLFNNFGWRTTSTV